MVKIVERATPHYACEECGEEYKLKVKGLKSEISSGKNVKTKNFEELEFSTDDPEAMKTVINNIFTN